MYLAFIKSVPFGAPLVYMSDSKIHFSSFFNSGYDKKKCKLLLVLYFYNRQYVIKKKTCSIDRPISFLKGKKTFF